MLMNWRRSVLPTLLLSALPIMSMAQVGFDISVNTAPPELPVYDQPPIPGDGYLWTPGYWAWSDDDQDYYWVPGTWVLAPQPGFLWTPGYWGSGDGIFLWHEGYWGAQVGFYGGVYYGYGYGGHGFEGGYWQGGHLFYNQSVVNIGTTNITNVYTKTVINNVTVNRVSYNGGSGGVQAQPTAAELAAARAPHLSATPAQRQQLQVARTNPALRAGANHGNPPIAATARPGAFSGAGVVAAKRGGTMSVYRQGSPAAPTQPRPAPSRTAPATPRPAPQEHEVQPRETPPAVELRRAPEPTRPSPPPRPQPHSPEHDHDRS